MLAALVLSLTPAHAEELVVGPYLQSVEPTSAWILWQTDTGTESTVRWGTTASLGQTTTGGMSGSFGGVSVHEVQLTDLTPDAEYWYAVKTGDLVGPTYRLRTPPLPAAEASTRLVVVSDMQHDGRHPEVWGEVVEDGMRAFLEGETGTDLVDGLDFVLMAGDLVDNGWSTTDWTDQFFTPARDLLAEVPSYWVLGNHEANTPLYGTYAHLPSNGTGDALFEEHWWSIDRNNIRVIGLDSNGLYRSPQQLAFLDERLTEACEDDTIDFVFAMLHHPFKSEVWLPGETGWTGGVVERLETFSTECGKPSIHFFGHTHAYSRGQSRDHRHLWVNAASAGGALDRWGEQAQADYEEFTVSFDEYGFVVVDVEAGETPTLRLRRVSRGDPQVVLDNVVQDDILLRKDDNPPETPEALFPAGDDVPATCSRLTGSRFRDRDGDAHGATHVQLAASCDGFDAPLLDRWTQDHNWYADVDTQAGDDLGDTEVPALQPLTTYCWRVRHRDAGLTWSAWSTPTAFTTGPALEDGTSDELLVNGGAEEDLTGWTVDEGIVESLDADTCNGTSPFEGERYFAVGGLCDSSAFARMHQDVDVTAWADDLAGDGLVATLSAALSDFSGDDQPEAFAEALDAEGGLLATSSPLTLQGRAWSTQTVTFALPADTATVRVVLTGTRHAGSDNDSYIDAVSLTVQPTPTPDACATYVAPEAEPIPEPEPEPEVPGPVDDDGPGVDAPESASGCGCAAGATGASPSWLLLLATLVWRRARRRRSVEPRAR